MSGKLKITGNIMAAQKLQQVWADEAEKVRGVLVDLKAGRDIQGSSAPPPAVAPSTQVDPDVAVSILNVLFPYKLPSFTFLNLFNTDSTVFTSFMILTSLLHVMIKRKL